MKKNLVIVFCKNSVIGKVKTRLAKTIGKSKALKVHNILLAKTISVLKLLQHDISVFHSDFKPKNNIWSFTKYQELQNGKNLGFKIQNAFKWGFDLGYKKICLIGSDLWAIEKNIFTKAFNALNSNDIVFGPSEDGGYYLIGLKKQNKKIFKITSWGSSRVLKDSINQIGSSESVYYLSELNDIDNENDLNKNEDLRFLIYNP